MRRCSFHVVSNNSDQSCNSSFYENIYVSRVIIAYLRTRLEICHDKVLMELPYSSSFVYV